MGVSGDVEGVLMGIFDDVEGVLMGISVDVVGVVGQLQVKGSCATTTPVKKTSKAIFITTAKNL